MRRRCCCVTQDPPTECCPNVPQPKPDWCYDPNCAKKVPSGRCQCVEECPERVNAAMPQYILLIVTGIVAKRFLPAFCNPATPCEPRLGWNGAFILYYQGCSTYAPVLDDNNRPTHPWYVGWRETPGGPFAERNPAWYLGALWNTAGQGIVCCRFNDATCECIPPSGTTVSLCVPTFAPYCDCDNSQAVAVIA